MTVIGLKKDVKKVFTERNSTPPDDFDDWDSHFMLRNDFDDFRRNDELWGQRGWFKPSCVPITIILVLIVLVVLLPLIDNAANAMDNQYRDQHLDDGEARLKSCRSSCRFTLVESIPQGMSYRNGTTPYPSTFDVWSELIKEANHSLDIGSFYWTLRDSDVGTKFRMRARKYTLPPAFQRAKYPGSDQGEQIFKDLVNAGTLRKLEIQVAQENPSKQQPNLDTDLLVKIGAAKVRSLNFNQILGSGVLHTKLWVTDGLNAYVGSANMDWRSLTQVKELGIYIKNCSCLAQDIHKIFDVYWLLGKTNRLPSEWPRNLTTVFNKDHPMNLTINNSSVGIYASSSPPQFCPKGRTSDIEAVIDVIQKAEKYIYIAVMDYYPLIIYAKSPQYWGVIDDALRAATLDNRVEVRILISWWKNSRQQEKFFLKSLTMLTGAYPGVKISVKLFVVPASAEQSKIPYARVNHNKYMVTDNTALIGTSNWSGDYFTVTAGTSVVITGKSEIRDQLEGIFVRDWNSEFTYDLPR